jgi:alpha-L-fucosidase
VQDRLKAELRTTSDVSGSRCDGPAKDVPPAMLKQKSDSLAFGKKATASNVFQRSPEFSPDEAFDDDPETRWGCDWGTHFCWLEVDLGEPKTFDRAWISEPYDRVQEFELQVWQDGRWKTFHRGTAIGESCSLRFPTVTGQRVRLNLLKTSEGPSIWEFQLFALGKP